MPNNAKLEMVEADKRRSTGKWSIGLVIMVVVVGMVVVMVGVVMVGVVVVVVGMVAGGGSGGGSGGGGVYIVCMYECMYSIYVVFIMYAWMWNVPRDCDHYIASSSHRYIF